MSNTIIRQEINILDGILSAAASTTALSNEIRQLDTTQYTSPTYYFEIVANTSNSITNTVTLRRKGTTTDDATVTIPLNTTSYTRLPNVRVSFSPPAGQTEYQVFINSAAGATTNVKVARIIVIQSAATIASTETQIEIGDNETGLTNTSAAALTNPKYWFFDTSQWNGTKTFYAEVTWKKTDIGTTSTTQTAASSYTFSPIAGQTYVNVELWGGGGAGARRTSNGGGGGGGGGEYAKELNVAVTPGNNYPYVVGDAGSDGASPVNGANSTFNTSTVVANGGGSAASNSATHGAGGTGSTNTTHFDGGAGADGSAGNYGGGGGGSGGTGSVGNTATTGTGATAVTGGGPGGNGKSSPQGDGSAPASGPGGGGGGGLRTSSGTRLGGAGFAGKSILTYVDVTPTVTIILQEDNGSFGGWATKVTIVNAVATSATLTRTRSASFVPTDGRNYRIVASISNGTNHSYDIYNAAIIVDQSANPTNIETQYLLANTKFAAGTNLQNYLNQWNSADWSNDAHTTFIHEANSVASGTSSIKLQDTTGPTNITNSTIPYTAERNQSLSPIVMPTSGHNIDCIAITNNNDIYCSRIIVRVRISSKPWFDGLPSEGLNLAANDNGTMKFWFDGLPGEYIFVPSAAVVIIRRHFIDMRKRHVRRRIRIF